MGFKVKEGVVLPQVDRTVPRNKKYPFATMNIGDLFFVPGVDGQKFSAYASQRGRVLERKFTTRAAIMRQDLQTDEWEPCKKGAPGSRAGVLVCRTE